MISILIDSVCMGSIVEELAAEAIKKPPSLKEISAVAKIAIGSVQVVLGIVVFPLQLCGRVFKHNKPFLITQGVGNLKKTQGVAKSTFGIFQVLFGIAFLPFQLCGRVFKSTQPLLLREGMKNTFRGLLGICPRKRLY